MGGKKKREATGRPRSFDADLALGRALQVFRERGYEGASLEELTKAMGINRPSLYAAFGDKESLFKKAVERYVEGQAGYVAEALKARTARGMAERLLRGAAELMSAPRHPSGCLLVQGALTCSKEGEPVRRSLLVKRAEGETAVRRRLRQAKREGDLPARCDPDELARWLMTTVYGMSVQAAGGASRAELRSIAEMTLRAWPK